MGGACRDYKKNPEPLYTGRERNGNHLYRFKLNDTNVINCLYKALCYIIHIFG